MNDIDQIRALSVITDERAGQLLTGPARADLAARITATTAGRPAASRDVRTRRWLTGTAVAAGLAAAAVIAALALVPGHDQGRDARPSKVRTVQTAALVFTRHGRYIDVIVRDPHADPGKYRAEFRAHGLDIALKLIPVSPSLVGTVVYFGGTDTSAIKTITARGRCFTGGGGPECPIGLRVPVHFRGQADLVFGRAARPGERYESTASSTAPGEALHGLRIAGRRVFVVLAMIAKRHVSVAVYHVTARSGGKLLPPGKVPGRWWVYTADPWAPGQVMLWVGPTRHQGPYLPAKPATPSPTASRS